MARILYIHVPKCGGSSFGAALRLRYLTSYGAISLGQGDPKLTGDAYIDSDYDARQKQVRRFVAQRKRLITGHVQYDPQLHATAAQDYRFVTLLRDPVTRFVSHYNYLQRHHPNPTRARTLDAFLDTPDAGRLASQYLYYFAGQHQGQTTDIAAAISRATKALHHFDLVGDLSDPSAFAAGLRRLTRTPILRWQRNTAPAPTTVPAALRRRIQDLCAPDIAIHNALCPQRVQAA